MGRKYTIEKNDVDVIEDWFKILELGLADGKSYSIDHVKKESHQADSGLTEELRLKRMHNDFGDVVYFWLNNDSRALGSFGISVRRSVLGHKTRKERFGIESDFVYDIRPKRIKTAIAKLRKQYPADNRPE